jgi:Zn-dependent membrane protease YugP
MVIAVLLFILLISLAFYIYINVTYKKYRKIKLKKELSGFEVARKIIDNYDLNNVYITESKTQLISKYDINRKVIRLTDNVFNDEMIVSCAISSFESVHAIQDKKNNKMFIIREKLSQFINILLIVGYLITLFGCFFGHVNTIIVGLSIIDFILLYHLIFYKVDLMASKMALTELINNNIIQKSEIKKIEKLLKVTSYTSFASIFFPIVELIKKIIVFGDSNR